MLAATIRCKGCSQAIRLFAMHIVARPDNLKTVVERKERLKQVLFCPKPMLIDHPLPDEFVPCFDGKFWRIPKYVSERGISDSSIIRHGLGYAESGRYRDRLIVPILARPSRTFIARLMGAEARKSSFKSKGKGRPFSLFLKNP